VADSRSFGAFAAALRATLQTTFGRENFDYLVNNAGIGINAPDDRNPHRGLRRAEDLVSMLTTASIVATRLRT
jgi:NAD(P)-dependent dehydrogenase (short-subunit alcohol dehydrogenase family)